MPFVVVAGTGTEVGKTYVGAALARELRERGVPVAARKPVQSFDAAGGDPTDAEVLASATGVDAHEVCAEHRWIPRAMAPPIAARTLGLAPFTIAELVAEVVAGTTGDDIVLVESAGGVRSPLAADGDTVSLADALSPAIVVLVADAGLGTINAVHMSADALADHRVVVFLNRFDPNDDVHVTNHDWLSTRSGLEIVTDLEALTHVLTGLLRTRDSPGY